MKGLWNNNKRKEKKLNLKGKIKLNECKLNQKRK